MDIFEAARTNNIDELKTSMQTTDVNAKDGRGSTALIIAAYYNNIEAVKTLIDAGADLELPDGMGNSALMGVCFKGYTEVAGLLLNSGASVITKNADNSTALIFAATFGHNDLIKLLLAHGANPQLPDRFGKNAIEYARVKANAEGYEMLVDAI